MSPSLTTRLLWTMATSKHPQSLMTKSAPVRSKKGGVKKSVSARSKMLRGTRSRVMSLGMAEKRPVLPRNR